MCFVSSSADADADNDPKITASVFGFSGENSKSTSNNYSSNTTTTSNNYSSNTTTTSNNSNNSDNDNSNTFFQKTIARSDLLGNFLRVVL